MQEMETQESGSAWKNPLREVGNTVDYSFPVERKEFLSSPSPFGMRQDPADGKERMHTGIDIRCDGDTVLATEKDGKVVAVKDKAMHPGNKSLTVEYTRPDGSRYSVPYMHLGEVSVKAGDTVQAGQKLSRSGNTGTRTTRGSTCTSVSGRFMRTARSGTSIRQRIWLKSHKGPHQTAGTT